MDVTVRISRKGNIEVIVTDETGYNPDVIDDMTRRARETALAVRNALLAET